MSDQIRALARLAMPHTSKRPRAYARGLCTHGERSPGLGENQGEGSSNKIPAGVDGRRISAAAADAVFEWCSLIQQVLDHHLYPKMLQVVIGRAVARIVTK